MDPTTPVSVTRPGVRRRASVLAVALLAACGGTSGIENIVAGDGAGLEFDSSIAEAAGGDAWADAPSGDAAADGDAAAEAGNRGDGATGVVDAPAVDRTVSGRPTAKDTGVAAMADASRRAVDAGVEAEGPLGTTYSILAAQSPQCLHVQVLDAADPSGNTMILSGCPVDNNCFDPAYMGGICEVNDSGLVATLGADGGAAPLDNPPSDYTANCLRTLRTVFSSKCMQSLKETFCLCGDAGDNCDNLLVEPNGPAYAEFKRSFHPAATDPHGIVSEINTDFTVQTYGAGQANALLQCLAAFGCDGCFGIDAGSD